MRFSGSALYQRRLQQDMSRADLASAIRHSSSGSVKATERGIRGWEKGEYAPRAEAVAATATALRCGIEDLYDRNGSSADDDDEEADSLGSLDDFLRIRVRQIMREEAQPTSPALLQGKPKGGRP